MTTARRPVGRGISLIEALVAMAIMAFGMLGVLGMQATLRANADAAKQRSEATRLAEEKIEQWRSFSVLPTTTGVKAYADIATAAGESLTSFISNTTYTRTVTVTDSTPAGLKTLVVDVAWADRAGTAQNVRLFSAATAVAPALAATMVAPQMNAGGVREPEGRRRGIPPQAKNFGDGTSGFRPPQPAGTAVVWVFNNVTGLITSVCNTTEINNADLTLAALTGCTTAQAYQLISGYLRFHTALTQPTAAEMANPIPGASVATSTIEVEVDQTAPTTGVRSCYHERSANYVEYFCAVPVTSPTPASWSGTLRVRPATMPDLAANLAVTAPTQRKVCRYRALTGAEPNPVYVGINVPLANENLAVIPAGNAMAAFTCPNPPSRAHQPNT